MNFNKPVASFYTESSIKRWVNDPNHVIGWETKANATKWSAASPRSYQD